MRIIAPPSINAQTMYQVLGQVFDEQAQPRSNRFEFELREAGTMDEAGAVMMDNLLHWLAARGCSTQLIEQEALPEVLSVLIDRPSTESLANDGDRYPGKLPLHRIAVAERERWLQRIFNNWLARQLYSSALMVAPQTIHLLELLHNIALHAGTKWASVAASYDAALHEVLFIIADAGRGIRASVEDGWEDVGSDEVAIVKAIEGNVGRGHAPPSGNGLYRFFEKIVDHQRGSITVTSGFGRLKCFGSAHGKVHRFEPVHAFFPGTMVEVIFPSRALHTISTFNEPVREQGFILK